jgi:hypothetical protein
MGEHLFWRTLMRKMGLFWFAAALLGAALIFAGCESPTSGSNGAAGAPGTIYLSGPQLSAGIQDALDSAAPVVFAGVVQRDDGSVTVPKGKGVKLVGPAAYSLDASVTATVILADEASIDATSTGLFDKGSGTTLTVIAPEALKLKVATDATFVELQSGATIEPDDTFAVSGDTITISDSATSATNINVSDLATAGTTDLYVVGSLTVSAAITNATIAINVVGNVEVSDVQDKAISWDVSGTLTASKAPTSTGAITANALNVTATTGATVLNTATGAITIGSGGVTTAAGAVTFGGAAAFKGEAYFTGPVTFGGTATFNELAVFGGDVTLSTAAATFGKTAFFADTKKITLTLGTSTIKLGAGAGLAIGTPSPNAPDVYNTVIINSGTGTDLTLTPAAGTVLTFSASTSGKGITQSGSGAHDIKIGGAAALIPGSTYTVLSAASAVGTLTIDTDATLTLATGVLLAENPSGITATTSGLVLTGAASDGAKLVGTTTGSLKAGATTITGTWQAVGAGTVTIAASSTSASSITATGSSVLTAGTGGVITQGAVSGNNLTIGADTTINLVGNEGTALGKLVLTGHASTPGEIVLTHATTSIVKTGLTAGNGAFTAAATIGTKTFAAGTAGAAAITTTAAAAAGKFATLTSGATGGKGLKGGSSASDTVTIDSTQAVA